MGKLYGTWIISTKLIKSKWKQKTIAIAQACLMEKNKQTQILYYTQEYPEIKM